MQFPSLYKQFRSVPSADEYAAAIARLRLASEMDTDGNFVNEVEFLDAHKELSAIRETAARVKAPAYTVSYKAVQS